MLVHGAWHGPWCWELLTPELEARGHEVVAVDLPIEDPAATFSDYADVVVDALDTDDAVVVGHSMAGLVLPLVAARRAVRHQVYLGAMVAEPGRNFFDVDREQGILNPAYPAGLAKVDGGSRWADAELARSLFYADCDDDVAAAAWPRLRMQARAPYQQPCPLDALPPVPATYIVCAEDRMVNPDWSRNVAVARLGAELVELPGGHSPFYSRPAALAEALTRLV